MYQALYRKWRPRSFDDVVGQAHITETLKRQVSTGRLSHAYLFVGTRGTGKTTCAKIFSRAVNCEHPVNGNPCNECPSCLGIESGAILDVEEIDAASNNGVDNIRALRDEAVYSPATVKKRVYIVDEVHMLSASAFNALLKILEEPPEHLMFILATTELHKVPATILSRCQRFNFKRLTTEDISGRLKYVAAQEHISLTEGGAGLLARMADGAMRDALSLLDQCGAEATVDEARIFSALGLAGKQDTEALFRQIRGGDLSGSLQTVDRFYRNGKDLSAVLDELVNLLRDILLLKVAGKDSAGLISGSYSPEELSALGNGLTAPRAMQWLQQLQSAAGSAAAAASSARLSTELCLIRMCTPAAGDDPAALSARLSELEEKLASGLLPAVPAPAAASAEDAPKPSAAVSPSPEPAESRDTPPRDAAAPQPATEPELAPAPVCPSLPEEEPAPPVAAEPVPAPAPDAPAGDKDSFASILRLLQNKLDPGELSFLSDPDISCRRDQNRYVIYCSNPFFKSMLDRPPVLAAIGEAASSAFGTSLKAVITDEPAPAASSAQDAAPAAQKDALDDLFQFGVVRTE